MKKIVVPLVSFMLLIACEEETPQPLGPDPFVGSWTLINDATPEIELSFDIGEGDNGLTIDGVQFKHPAVPETEALEYSTNFHYRYSVNAACKEMKVRGEGEQSTAIITMINNSIPLMKPDELTVFKMRIDIKGHPMDSLMKQVFVRTR